MERRRARTVLDKDSYEAIGQAPEAPRPKPWAPESVRFVQQGTQRTLQFLFPTTTGAPVSLGLPVDGIEELKGARLADLRTARLSPSHTAVIVDGVDAFISVEGLFRDLLGDRAPAVKALMVHAFAARGGRATSVAKKRSSAENGRKGGRPGRKQAEPAVAGSAG